MEIDYLLVGNRIRRYRKLKNLSQEELADLTEMSNSYISDIENGRKEVKLDKLLIIANVLEVSIESLLIDCLENTNFQKDKEVDLLLLDCSPAEEAILKENMISLKEILRKHEIK